MSNGIPPHFIVIVPGYMGSKLRDPQENDPNKLVWIDFQSIPANPLRWDDWIDDLFSKLTYPFPLEPAGIVEELMVVLPWAKMEHYGRLLAFLANLGYHTDPSRFSEAELDVYSFSYDWRQDNRVSARRLGEAVERWSHFHPGAKAWLIGHSNGGIVSRWYIEKEGGKDRVGRNFLMASPLDGAPKAIGMMIKGLEMMFRRGFNAFGLKERSIDLVRSFPSLYNLVPMQHDFLEDGNGQVVNPYVNLDYLANETQRQMMREGQRFNEELGTSYSVETLCFFGRKVETTTGGIVRFGAGGKWEDIEWVRTTDGDGTVPEFSALHPGAHEKLPFIATHGDIYIVPPVLEFLQWELRDRYLGDGTRASLTTAKYRLIFEPDKDVYDPGETVGLWATIDTADAGKPVSRASITAKLSWRQALPGLAEPDRQPAATEIELREHPDQPGRYEGRLTAPLQEGYYQIQASILIPNQRRIELEELIAVEGLPDIP